MSDETEQVGGEAAQPSAKWGDPISEERQAELRALFERQKEWVAQPEAMRGGSVFKDVRLTGADVYWLAEAMGRDQYWEMTNLHLEGADLSGAQLKGAILIKAWLEGADLSGAQLKGAILFKTGLEGANLTEAELEGADLTSATFDKTSHLSGALLPGASLDQVTYDGVNLTVVDWSLVPVLGDELTARQRIGVFGKRKDRAQRIGEFTAAVRAYRVLAVTLRSQGMNEDADRYTYRAQLMQREVLRRQGKLGQWVFSWLLWALAGYGYRLQRILFTYVLTLTVFALVYAFVGLPNDHAVTLLQHVADANQVSLTALHGRTFFEQFGIGSTLAWVAGAESVCGLVIEAVFTSMLVQRFFAR